MPYRVTLKNPSYEDYAHFYDLRFKPNVVYWADDYPRQMTLDEYAMERLMAQQNGQIIERIIVVDDEPVGTITARDFIAQTCQCTLGIVIANEHYWGHGVGSQALKLFLRILSIEGIGLVVLETYANNKRAQHCFTKLGFQKRRVFFAPQAGRFVVQMLRRLSPNEAIGEKITYTDPRWKAPKRR